VPTPLLTTKLYIPPFRPRERLVPRPRLIERLNEGPRLSRKLALVSAPAGFGKTTLLSEWVAAIRNPQSTTLALHQTQCGASVCVQSK
jgi:LuxR family maltose regulon positive regulatory protein